MKFPSIILKTPESTSEINHQIEFLEKNKINTIFLHEGKGLNVFYYATLLREKLEQELEFGLCVHSRDKNLYSQISDFKTAEEMNFKYIFIHEPDYSLVKPVNSSSSLDLIKKLSMDLKTKMKIIVQNSFFHENDLKLLEKQFHAGAEFVMTKNQSDLSEEYNNKLLKYRNIKDSEELISLESLEEVFDCMDVRF